MAIASCGEPDRVVTHLPIPPERIDCEPLGVSARPALPPEYRIDWSAVENIQQAYDEHRKFVASVRNREGLIAGYIVDVEGALWACASDDEWLRDREAGLTE